MAFIERIEFLGEPAVKAGCGSLEAVFVPGMAGSCLSLTYVPKGLALLRVPESAEQFWAKPVLFGIPVLFPPNRIEDGVFSHGGTDYRFDVNEPQRNNHIHGLAYNVPWELADARDDDGEAVVRMRFRSEGNEQVLRQFPHAFELLMTYRLSESKLTVMMEISNRSDSVMPWGLGYHTTFNFPFSPEGDIGLCEFSLTADDQWELNDRLMPTGKRFPIRHEGLREGIIVKGVSLDDVFGAAPDADGRNEAVLRDRNENLTLIYRCDDSFKFWVVYNRDSRQGFLCPEPYTWVTNAPNLDLAPEITGFRTLNPGESFTLTSEIIVKP